MSMRNPVTEVIILFLVAFVIYFVPFNGGAETTKAIYPTGGTLEIGESLSIDPSPYITFNDDWPDWSTQWDIDGETWMIIPHNADKIIFCSPAGETVEYSHQEFFDLMKNLKGYTPLQIEEGNKLCPYQDTKGATHEKQD